MFLSVLRIRLIYSPFYRWLRPLRPLEAWIYKKLRAPQPRRGPEPAVPGHQTHSGATAPAAPSGTARPGFGDSPKSVKGTQA